MEDGLKVSIHDLSIKATVSLTNINVYHNINHRLFNFFWYAFVSSWAKHYDFTAK